VRDLWRLLLLASVGLVRLTAQETGGVAGLVISTWDGKPLGGVTVVVRGTTLAGQTDSTGRYELKAVQPGDQVLRFTKGGYAGATVTDVRVLPGQTTTVNGNLRPEFFELDEFEVTAEEFNEQTSQIMEERSEASGLLDSIGSDQFARVGASDAADIVSKVPGITVADGKILFGLAAIKGCGSQAAEAISSERARGGRFRDLYDFCSRLDPSVVNKTAVESLAKAGALDSLGGHRGALMAGIERALAAGASRLADRKSGQKNLFDALDDTPQAAAPPPAALPDVPPLSDLEMRSAEKEVLGYYVHSHPLAEYRDVLSAVCTHGTGDLGDAKPKSDVVIGGLVGALKLSNVKQPRPGSTHTRYGMFDLEDMDGLVRTICWPEDYARLGECLQPDAVIVVAGSIDRRAGSEETNLIVNDLVPIADIWGKPARSVTIKVIEPQHDAATLDRLAAVVRRHPGAVPLRLVLELADGRRVLMEADRDKVSWTQAFHKEVVDLLGPDCLRAPIGLAGKKREAETSRRGPPGRSPAGVG
jgi:hypothetical protein